MENICRLCLSADKTMEPLFDAKENLLEEIEKITALKIDKVKGIPSLICEECENKLQICINFRLLCVKTDEFLKQEYSNLFEEKKEDIVEPTKSEKQLKQIALEPIKPNETPKVEEEESFLEYDSNEELSDVDSDFTIAAMSNKKKKNISGKYRRKRCKYCKELVFNLRKHCLEKHNVEKKDKKYACPICNKGFMYNSFLANHMTVHDGEIKCKVCSKCFISKSRLKFHMRMHSPEMPFKCRFCGQGFPFQNGYNMHERACQKKKAMTKI